MGIGFVDNSETDGVIVVLEGVAPRRHSTLA